MTKEERKESCEKYFSFLCNKLKDTHVLVASCNKDASRYLVPKGTEDRISWYGKPRDSYRISDHWNWKTNLKNCSNEHYVQCFNKDIWIVNQRIEAGKASKAVNTWCVAYYDDDDAYHTVHGSCYHGRKEGWTWKEGDTN